RNRLIRWLVTEQGFTAVALETGLATSRRISDYALGKTNESDSAAASEFESGFAEFEQNRQLLRWLRDYNRRKAPDSKVHFHGIDIESQGDRPVAYRALEVVLTSI